MDSAAQTAGISRENRALRRELGYDEAMDRIIGTSPAVKALKATIKQVASSGATVLIDGESGTGKELVADALHTLSERSARPYVKLNTAAIPRDLLESELFGHERGSFTGAVQQKKGKFEAADTGTIFLDEIGEMSMDAQVKLLRVLQDGTFNRVGGNQELSTNVRLICATNRNLKQGTRRCLPHGFILSLKCGQYSRAEFTRAPRRHPVLAKAFVDRLNQRQNDHKVLSEEAMATLRRMDWPGNIRELENTVEKLYVMSTERTIQASQLRQEQGLGEPEVITTNAAPSASQPEAAPACNPEDAISHLVGLPMDEVERRMILATLDHCSGNKSKAARLLGIGLKTLYRKLEAYNA